MIVIALSSFARADDEPDRLVLLDGGKATGVIASIDGAGKIALAGADKSAALDELRQIDRPVKPGDRRLAPVELYLAGGGVLLADALDIKDETFTVKWAYGDALTLPLDAVRAVKWLPTTAAGKLQDRPQDKEAFAAALAHAERDKDRLLVRVDDKVQMIVGLFEQFTSEKIVIQWEGASKSIPAKQVYAIAFAQVGAPREIAGRCLVTLKDGTSVGGKIAKLEAGKLTVQLFDKIAVELPWADVVRINVTSDRLAFLSDLVPLEERHEALLLDVLKRTWKADRNVLGKTLVVGGKAYDKGIGMTSRSTLVFARGEKFDTLSAVIGIDAAARPPAECEFVVLLDGKEAFRQKMKTGEAPREIRVELGSAEKVALAVEPGADFDWSDYADWCDARLLRTK